MGWAHYTGKLNMLRAAVRIYRPSNTSKHLCIAEDLPKVDVEHVSRLAHHDVVVVAVTDPQHIGSHTVASTRESKVLHCLHTHTHNRSG